MSPETKKLLERARRSEAAPDNEAKDRLRRNVLASIATTAGVAATGSASAAGAGSTAVIAGSTSFTALKIGAVGLVVAAAGVVTVHELSTSEDGAPTTQAAPAISTAAPPDAAARDAIPAAIPEGPSTAPTSVAATDAVATAEPVGVATATAKPSAVRSTVTSSEAAVITPESLDAERAIISSARTKLANGDSAGALAALAEHASAHPRGALSSERRAMTAIAYCNQGSVAQGLRAFPLPADGTDSPLSARVRAACAK